MFSDIVWHHEPAARSLKAADFWNKEYPDISSAADVANELTLANFNPLDPVLTDRKAWSNYYEPLRDRICQVKKQGNIPAALTNVITELDKEIDVYDSAGDDVALCFFLARRNSD